VLHEDEPAAGPEHTAELAHHARLVVDAAEHERRHSRISALTTRRVAVENPISTT
jgi:hypothetical protein